MKSRTTIIAASIAALAAAWPGIAHGGPAAMNLDSWAYPQTGAIVHSNPDSSSASLSKVSFTQGSGQNPSPAKFQGGFLRCAPPKQPNFTG
jgi:hypothetical protein